MAALTVEFPQTVWTVEFGGDEVVVAPVTMAPGAPGGGGGGAVDSVNGQTGTVVLDAGDVGAVPVSRTITAGAGLVGGGDLSADRTLAQAAAGVAVAVSAVDGTATTFHIIVPSPGAAAAAPIPAGWADAGGGALPVSFLPAGVVVVRPGQSALGEPFGLYRIPAGGALSGPWESLPLAIGQVIGVGTFGSTVIAGTNTGAGVEAITPDTRIDGVDDAVATHTHSAADITSGTVATARLGSGTADNTTFLRGDQTWAAAGSPRPALPRTSGAWYTLGGITNNAATTTPNAAGMLVAHPVWLPAGSYDRVGVATSAAGTATWRLGLYPSDPTAVTPDGLAPVASLGTIDMSATPGVLTATITLTVPTAGLYWAAVLVDAHTSAPTVYGWDGNSARAAFLPWDGYLIADGGIRGMWARYVSGIPTGAMPATYPVSISTDVRIPQVRFRAA